MADLIQLFALISAAANAGFWTAACAAAVLAAFWLGLAVHSRLTQARRGQVLLDAVRAVEDTGFVGEPYQPDEHTDPATALEIVRLDAPYHGPAYGEDDDR